MKLSEDFIGFSPNTTISFCPGDNAESFQHNLLSQPDDWYYRNNPILYTYNEFGHRCKSVNELDLDNYILFTGCSYTAGTGLAIEHSYPYVVSSKLGCDYYNLGIGSSGIDVLTYNLIKWITFTKKLPKALVVQWPEYTRFSIYDGYHSVQPQVAASKLTNFEILQFMVLGEEVNFFASRQKLCKKIISLLYDCQILSVGVEEQPPLDADVRLVVKDLARDCAHPGILSNEKAAHELLALLR